MSAIGVGNASRYRYTDRGCTFDRVTVPLFLVGDRDGHIHRADVAVGIGDLRTVTSYTLSMLVSVGISWSGFTLKVSAPAVLMSNLPPSKSPATDQAGDRRIGPGRSPCRSSIALWLYPQYPRWERHRRIPGYRRRLVHVSDGDVHYDRAASAEGVLGAMTVTM